MYIDIRQISFLTRIPFNSTELKLIIFDYILEYLLSNLSGNIVRDQSLRLEFFEMNVSCTDIHLQFLLYHRYQLLAVF